MQKRSARIGIGVLALIVAGGLFVFLPKDKPTMQDTAILTNATADQPVMGDSTGTVLGEESDSASAAAEFESAHPVSIAGLIAKQHQGSDFQIGAVLDRSGAYTRYAISYKSGDLTITGIMNIPEGDGLFPVLLLNHGYIDPAVYTTGRGLRREQDYLARRGFAVLHIDYRNHAGSSKSNDDRLKIRLGYIEDAINAVLALQASQILQIDASRVGMLGHSMGGGVSINAAVIRPDLFDAVVLFAPVDPDLTQSYRRWMERRPEDANEIAALYGTPESNPEFWEGLDSRPYFGRIDDPFQVHHGTADESVPIEWSTEFDAAMKAAGNEAEYYIYEDEPHEFTQAWGLVMGRVDSFFRKNLF